MSLPILCFYFAQIVYFEFQFVGDMNAQVLVFFHQGDAMKVPDQILVRCPLINSEFQDRALGDIDSDIMSSRPSIDGCPR